jgi:hypothetical protein
MTTSPDPLYAGYRYPAELIGYAVWLYFRFPLSLRMVEEMLAARGISVTYETIRQWGLKFGREFANRIRRRLPGDWGCQAHPFQGLPGPGQDGAKARNSIISALTMRLRRLIGVSASRHRHVL